jgi:hypothetical protein
LDRYDKKRAVIPIDYTEFKKIFELFHKSVEQAFYFIAWTEMSNHAKPSDHLFFSRSESNFNSAKSPPALRASKGLP